jgi:Fic family protein
VIRGPQGDSVPVSVASERFSAFLPRPLPPDPALLFNPSLVDDLEQANRALGRLDALSTLLPDPSLFLYLYIRKEAVLSSQIEGTQSTLADLLLYEHAEAPGVPVEDVAQVSRYVAALQHGLARLRGGFPLSSRLIREVHAVLITSSELTPGEFRRSQNWIGGTRPGNARFVPPPWTAVDACIANLERFIHDQDGRTPTLLKAAIAHVQFETIHPFLDGNGRLGRLLVTLILCAEGAIREPLLYLSLYLREHRQFYFELLERVRLEGDWEAWAAFFIEGVRLTATQATVTAEQILALHERDRMRIRDLGPRTTTAQRLHDMLRLRPMISIKSSAAVLGVSLPAVAGAVTLLESLEIVREITGRRRDRLFAYSAYLDVLGAGPPTLKG